MRRITEIFDGARAQVDAMGSAEFVRRLHAGGEEQNENMTRLKEDLELGYFAEQYNAANEPALVWAQLNPPGSGHADFTVWSEDKSWSRDLELTSAWEDEDAFPKTQNKDNPGMIDVLLSEPREPLRVLRDRLQRAIENNLKRHAKRRNYPPYWLAIYVNFSREAYQVKPDWVAEIVREALRRKPPTPNVERAWVWTHGRLDLVFGSVATLPRASRSETTQ